MFSMSSSFRFCWILYLQQVPEVEVATPGDSEGAMSIEMKEHENDKNVSNSEGDNNGNDEKTDEDKDDNDNTGEGSGGADTGGECPMYNFYNPSSPIPK